MTSLVAEHENVLIVKLSNLVRRGVKCLPGADLSPPGLCHLGQSLPGAGIGAVGHYEPDDLTVTVGAGTSFAEIDATLAEHGQECPLDPRSPEATIGGIVPSCRALVASGPQKFPCQPVGASVSLISASCGGLSNMARTQPKIPVM